MASWDYDLLVIGGGSGGVRAARMSAGFGAKVALVEGGPLGGTCVNVGCVPKKLLVYAASFADEFRDARGFGWSLPGAPRFDWPTLIANKDREIARLNEVYQGILGRAGVDILRGWARFEDPHTVRIGDRTVRAAKILVATGGKPKVIPIPGHELAITSNEAFSLDALPKRIVIAGGGYIGLEFASLFNLLGVETHLVHKDSYLLNAFDGDVRRHVTEQVRLKGVHVHHDHTVERVEKRGAELVAVLDDGTELAADLQMAAVGRVPNTDGLNLEAAGVEVAAGRGGIVVDDGFRTSQPHVFALGDVIDRVALTPVALGEGMAFARAQFGGEPEAAVDYESIPTAVFSVPQVGTVGLGEEAAWHRGEECLIYRSVFRPMKYTLADRHEKMLMKLVVCAKTDRVLGVHVVGPDAGEIVQGFAVALKGGATKAQLDATVGIHPTAAEELVTMREPVSPHPLDPTDGD
ncbi:MAG TPA: glutathione-disulfide reductase [Polyangiaceae bacterium LLY-WYZ-15_(1-7)]|nr:glutathione-disulfide reductase [Myxococcales bacterium]MAT28339.1 glutathione-disulfide reductase [Sandaracinus sp.]HJL05734.1 glutathione-disulfide reductase [Polyangiaceae bacterium LLY-WYZ-15_(1-7)]HJL08340.1 glutathione-disulfide reductase [Polyangiaceae bacterium LLY-WYZ-15_(1-7)]HJL27106.1 glutathione-disulfide reductase [Polyangiaceae bacterium LLY-WYZ-15_(1-7)]